MKNFTNNFKQFTSRLSARWLIMAFMLLAGTSSVWGWSISANRNVYLYDATTTCNVKLQVWANNSWDNTHDMTKLGNGVYQYKVGNEGYNNYSGFQFIKDCSTKSYVGPFYQDINSVNSCMYNNSWSFPPVWSLTIANNGTNVSKGGSGTQADPYLVPENSTVKVKVSSVGYEENGLGIQYSWKSTGAATSYAANDTDDSFTIGAAGTVVGVVCDAKTEYGDNLCSVGCASNTIYFKSYTTCAEATLSWANTFTGNMKVGEDVSNPASLSDAAAGSITYESSDPSVIEVDGNTLRVLKSGTATITASATPNTGFCSIESIEKEVNVTCDVVNTEDIRIEVVCTSGDNPYIWAWEPDNNHNNLTGGNWPGQAMTPEGNNVYSWKTKPTSGQSVSITISKNKEGGNQTNDINGLEIGKRYKFSYDPNTLVSGSKDRYVYQLLEDDCLPPACVAPADPTISITPEGLCGEGTVTITVEDSHIAEMYQLYIVNNGYTKRGTAQKRKIFTETPSKTTTYVIKALNGKCTSNYSNEVTLTVYTQPTITQTKNTICKGEVINLNDCVSKVPDNATLTWYSDDARSAELSGDALNISPATETTYYYQASIGGACTVDGSITLTVNDLPENVDFGTNNTASVCQNASVNLTTLSAWTKDGQTIQWYSKDGDNYTSIDANQTITADCTFYAKAIFSNTGCESEGYSSFEITTLPSPDAPTLQPITVCPQVGFDLTEKSEWTAPDDGSLNISWYEKSDEKYVAVNSEKLLNQGITQATTYYARVQNKETGCYSAYVSMSVSVATVSELTITPATGTGTTTPWVPISYTVDTDKTFEMSYPDGLTSLPNIEITQSNNGKTYTYKIPRPTDWGTGNATPARTAKTFTIQAMLTGSSAECPSIGTATVTLQDEDNDNCTK